MPPYEMRIEVRHNCPFSNTSAKFPNVTLRLWCNAKIHIIEVIGDSEEELMAIEKESILVGCHSQSFWEEGGLRIMSKECDCDQYFGITDTMNNLDCWYVEPLEVRAGWERYRIFAYSRENLAQLVNEIRDLGGEVRLLYLKQVGSHGVSEPFLPSSSILSGLTEKQMRALSEAFAFGYFEEPSQVSANKLAGRMGVSRSTFSEHLRKAEKKLIFNLFPIIQMAVNEDTETGG